ncbi:MAG: M28 family peptidase [Syntrophobacteraceae bacterium]|nr:M28 family peptidase [Syntrophobacteraceae bacterium]
MHFPGSTQETIAALQDHVRALTVEIGERSVNHPKNLARAAGYIRSFYEGLGLPVILEPYGYRDFQVANVITEVGPGDHPSRRYILGAHYDTARGTVGADDNASAIAVQLEVARQLNMLHGDTQPDLTVKCVSFTLEERPAFWTPYRGSWVHARRMRRAGEAIDGMLCLEMVGYCRRSQGSQKYPFPLTHLGYPGVGDFVAVVSDGNSKDLAGALLSAFGKNPDLPVQSLTVPLKGWLSPFVRRSDHVSFWDLGYKAVMITDTANFRNPNYHKESDTMDTLDYSFMAELVESLLLFFGAPR